MIKCRDIIPISYSISIDDILKHARDYGCDITFNEQIPSVRSCSKGYFGSCSSHSREESELADICHEIPDGNFATFQNSFKNEFCYLCNLEKENNTRGRIETVRWIIQISVQSKLVESCQHRIHRIFIPSRTLSAKCAIRTVLQAAILFWKIMSCNVMGKQGHQIHRSAHATNNIWDATRIRIHGLSIHT